MVNQAQAIGGRFYGGQPLASWIGGEIAIQLPEGLTCREQVGPLGPTLQTGGWHPGQVHANCGSEFHVYSWGEYLMQDKGCFTDVSHTFLSVPSLHLFEFSLVPR